MSDEAVVSDILDLWGAFKRLEAVWVDWKTSLGTINDATLVALQRELAVNPGADAVKLCTLVNHCKDLLSPKTS
jgi:hypothetical protein